MISFPKCARCWKYSLASAQKCLFFSRASLQRWSLSPINPDYPHFVRGATSTKGRKTRCRTHQGALLKHNQRRLSYTYLNALRLRHLSPEEHAPGRVLNSHRSRQNREMRSHLIEVYKRMRKKTVCASTIFLSLSCNSHSHPTTAVFFRNKSKTGKTARGGPKSVAAIKCAGFHGAKVCSPPESFPGERERKRHHSASEMRWIETSCTHQPANCREESQRIAALKKSIRLS